MSKGKQDNSKGTKGLTPKWKLALMALKAPMPEMGVTKREHVWKKNKATLWYYPPVEKKYRVPVFIVYSLINQPVILDLGPGMSMIEAFGKEGYEVYLLDFGSPGYEDGETNIDNYILDYIQKGVQRALRHSGAKEITIIGSCIGGTLVAMYAAVADEPIKNLILSAAPVDFSHSPTFDQWAEAIRDDSANFDEFLDAIHIIPAGYVKKGMRLITSPIYYSPYLSLLNKADDAQYVASWRRLNAWTNGHIPLTGAAIKQMMHDWVRHNKLVKDTLYIKDKRASLKNIKSNLLVVTTENENLVPFEMIKPVMNLVSSKDKTYRVLERGHATISITDTLPLYIAEWLPSKSEPIRKGNEF
ncbi:alpha/beta fold hydrolase [Peribacillus sp. B-H-3]|uniref:alpha/beta fold hydrolase n=1 Tax=Peribacillus sp. B-H-3 TaxID=3400420 RepID=UPI003B01471B